MIFMADTPQSFEQVTQEIGCPVEQLLTPLTRRAYRGGMWACDNGAYSAFQGRAFESLLARQKAHIEACRWVAMPDVVGSARRTLECFARWADKLHGWPKALVAQDGQEDLGIPWDEIECIFIGGTTEWKGSDHAMQIAKAARVIGKWVHVGRINTALRMKRWEDVADSFDGTGLSRYSHMRMKLTEPRLFDAVETAGSGSDAAGGEVAD